MSESRRKKDRSYEESDSSEKDDSSDSESDEPSSPPPPKPQTKPARKRRYKKHHMKSIEERRNERKESNRLSAQRSRRRQKILEVSLQEQIDKLQQDKTNLETRFKNGIKAIFKLWPLPEQIPAEFSSLGLLLSLIDQYKKSRASTTTESTPPQETQPTTSNPNRNRPINNENTSVINVHPRVNLQSFAASQIPGFRTIINPHQSSTRTMELPIDPSSLASLANSGILQQFNQQYPAHNIFHHGQEVNSRHIENQSSITSHYARPILIGTVDQIRNAINNESVNPIRNVLNNDSVNQIRNVLTNEPERNSDSPSKSSNQRQCNNEK